ncbi:MAG: hypothetical protein WBF88_05800 [Pusillimonas sp.]
MQDNQTPQNQPGQQPNTPAQQPGRDKQNLPDTNQPVQPGTDRNSDPGRDGQPSRPQDPSRQK